MKKILIVEGNLREENQSFTDGGIKTHTESLKDSIAYFRIISASECVCNTIGTKINVPCNSHNGACVCREGFAGQYCDKCAPGYYNYPACTRKCKSKIFFGINFSICRSR